MCACTEGKNLEILKRKSADVSQENEWRHDRLHDVFKTTHVKERLRCVKCLSAYVSGTRISPGSVPPRLPWRILMCVCVCVYVTKQWHVHTHTHKYLIKTLNVCVCRCVREIHLHWKLEKQRKTWRFRTSVQQGRVYLEEWDPLHLNDIAPILPYHTIRHYL